MIEVEVNPEPVELQRSLDRLAAQLKDMRPAFRELAPALSRGLAATISSGGATAGESWPALSPIYLRRKAHEGYSRAPLVRTGALLRETAGGRGRLTLTPAGLSYVPSRDYGSAVNKRRPWMVWGPALASAMAAGIDAQIGKLVDEAGR